MSIVNPPAITPVESYPFLFGLLSYFQADDLFDSHAWANGEGIVWQSLACTPVGQPYDGSCVPVPKGPLSRAVRPSQSALPKFFEDGVVCSTVGVSVEDMKALAIRGINATMDLQVDADVTAALVLAAIPQGSQPNPLCALARATDVATRIQGDGRALVHISAFLASYAFNYHLLTIKDVEINGKVRSVITDPFGNIYRVSRSQPFDEIYVETEAQYAIYLSSLELLDLPPDIIAKRNDREIRASQGYIIQRSSCAVASIQYSCP